MSEELKRSSDDKRKEENLANQPSARLGWRRDRETARSCVDLGGHFRHRFSTGERVSVCGKVIRRTPESLRYGKTDGQ